MLDRIVSTKVDDELGKQIQQIARLAERPISQVVRLMLKRHIQEHGATLAALAKQPVRLCQDDDRTASGPD